MIGMIAVEAMAGCFFILDDLIFSSLAVSLIFGLSSTVLILVVNPVVYYAAMRKRVEEIRSTSV